MDLPLKQRKLYRLPERGMVKGVCAGAAEYLGVPVILVRIMTVISLLCGLFLLTLLVYGVLAYMLPVASAQRIDDNAQPMPRQQLQTVDGELQVCEQRLRRLERYVTSETFNVQRDFHNL